MSYVVRVDDAGQAWRAFDRYARQHPGLAARALTRLEVFAKVGPESGEFLRGNHDRSIFVVPPGHRLTTGTEPAFLVLVDESTKIMEPLRFVHPPYPQSMHDHVAWAEALLEI